jgi:hypothetical protein
MTGFLAGLDMYSGSAAFLVYLQFLEYFLCQLDIFEAVETLFRIRDLLCPAFEILRPG